MNWQKKGFLFNPVDHLAWAKSHAQVPTALVKEDEGIVRVYFAGRPQPNMSLTGFVDLDMDNLEKVVYAHPSPILDLGSPGFFDEHGIMPSSVIVNDGLVYLYYSGWSRSTSLPYNNYTGLAISEDGGRSFVKYSPGPIIDRTPFEIYSGTSPAVIIANGSWHMWYSSGTAWHEINGKMEHVYDLKYAVSDDGRTWSQTNEVAIGQTHSLEAITRPTVLKLGARYHMWFCYRDSRDFRGGAGSYRLGYASSENLVHWQRADGAVALAGASSDWGSEMMAYPDVVAVGDQYVMFYNGNGFGRDGFGYAILE